MMIRSEEQCTMYRQRLSNEEKLGRSELGKEMRVDGKGRTEQL
jgi:hypothetical protein